MANPKRTLIEMLELARTMSDDQLSAKNLRAITDGGGHERVALVHLARAIELGRESASRLKELPAELGEAVHLPDLGKNALQSALDVDSTVLTPHQVAVTLYQLVTKLQSDEKDAGHRQLRRVLEDSDRQVATLKAELDARDAAVQAAEQRMQLSVADGDEARAALQKLSAAHDTLTAKANGLEMERAALKEDVARHLATIEELTRRGGTELLSLMQHAKQVIDSLASATREFSPKTKRA